MQRKHVQILLQKEEQISATTLRNLQQPSDFLQGLIRGTRNISM